MDTADAQTPPPQDFDIRQLVEDARKRWLKPAEICEILNNHRMLQFSEAAPSKPESGSLFLFDRSKLRYFRKDGHNWRKKKDGRTVREAHEKLKADSRDVLHCYYAHGEDNPFFQRRSYWLLDREFEHIVLVHYREVTEGSNHRILDVSARRLEAAEAHSPSNVYRPVLYDSSHGSLSSPSEFQSTSFDSQQDFDESPADEWADSRVGTVQPLQQLQATFYKNLSVELDVDPLNDGPSESKHSASTSKASTQDAASKSKYLYDSRTSSAVPLSGPQLEDSVDPTSWSSYLASSHDPVWQSAAAPSGHDSENSILNRTVLSETGGVLNSMNELGVQSITTLGETSQAFLAQQESTRQALDEASQGYKNEKLEITIGNGEPELRTLNEVQTQNQPVVSYMPEASSRSQKFLQNEFDLQNDLLNFVLDDTGLITSLEGSSKVEPEWEILPGHAYPSAVQSFNILDFTPEWSYSCEEAKVIVTITGLDNIWNPSTAAWYCMFGDIAVPAEVICTGVLRCKSPLHEPGRVPFYVTCNGSPSSDSRTFEYRGKSTTSNKCSQGRLLLQVRLAEILSTSEDATQTTYGQTDFGILETTNLKEKTDSLVVDKSVWGELGELAEMESYLPCEVKDILLQTLLKHKLQHWIAMKRQDPKGVSTLGDHGVGVLHLTAALGYEWAIPALLSAGAGINFRDKKGKTALHWAAEYGREKMVALLLAAGADPGALSDPTPKDPTGRTAADLAASSGHDGIAGYLAETSLTKHLVTLKLNENEMNKGSGVAADRTVELLSEKRSAYEYGMTEDQLSLKDTLAAVRNATQAAAGIQAVFRAISFQKKHATNTCELDEYGVLKEEAMAFAASQTNQRAGPREKLNLAATQIQCKYRGWKDRKNFLTLKHHVVKIQAHFRGYQVRNKYKKLLWMVGLMDKIILRWRRKGSGLRRFRAEEDEIPDNNGFMEVFRKQKEEAFQEALSRVKGMLQNPEARNQYRRMLENHQNEMGAQATDVDELMMSLLEAE